eukprot:360142-Chlamydomonas_euryale.AAC.4
MKPPLCPGPALTGAQQSALRVRPIPTIPPHPSIHPILCLKKDLLNQHTHTHHIPSASSQQPADPPTSAMMHVRSLVSGSTRVCILHAQQ